MIDEAKIRLSNSRILTAAFFHYFIILINNKHQILSRVRVGVRVRLGLGLGFELELRLRREAGVEKNIFMIVSRDLLRKNDHVVKVGSGPVDLLVDAVGLLFLIRSLHSVSTMAASIRMKSIFWLFHD